MRNVVLAIVVMAACGCGGGPTNPDRAGNSDNEILSGACGYTVRRGDTARTVPSDGGNVSVQVTTMSANSAITCNWTVSMSDAARSFMTLVDPESGSSSATQAAVTLTVGATTGGQRQGVVTIANVPFTITQTAAPCALSLGGDLNVTFPPGGGTGHVTVTRTRGAGCAWTASSGSAFITGVTPASGADDGTVTFTVTANTGAARTGSLTIAGQSVPVNQSGVDTVVPAVASISPSTVSLGATIAITVNGTGFDPATAQIAVTGPACPASAPCIVPNAQLTTRTTTQLAGPVTLRNAGAFTLQVQNGSGGPLSNAVPLTVVTPPTTTPVLTAIAPGQFTVGSAVLTITGTGFDPPSAQVAVTGPGCPSGAPCVVTNAELTTRTATQLVAPVRLLTAGTYTMQVQNGQGAPLSNGLTVTVSPAPTPSIASVSPTEIPSGVTTSLMIAGANFDPALAQLAVVGPGCSQASPCIVTNGELTSRSPSQLVAPITLRTAGSYTIQVQNGSGGNLSNAVAVTVR